MSVQRSSGGSPGPNPPISFFHSSAGARDGSPLIGPPTRPGILGTVGRFELLQRLGEGGMGIVFLARDTSVNLNVQAPAQGQSLVALKILKPGLAGDRRASEYFLKEATHMQRLAHPHILPILEPPDDAKGAYFVMLYVSGAAWRIC